MMKILLFLLCLAVSCSSLAASRGITITDASGAAMGQYSGSHALVVGVSDYVNGWPDLQNVKSELDKVSELLTRKGFQVRRVDNPNGKQLEDAFEDFIDDYGYDENNRLLFFFGGHGYSRNNGDKGYLVPSDAPRPNVDERNFLRKAYAMTDLLALARKMEVNHALFLFDSCFSGTIFKTRALPENPPLINRLTSKPVRQFITAGDAGEEVPAKSVFTPAFIDALEYGLGDLNSDGFVTGTELGLYLQDKVANHSQQTPQFGKISDYELSRGDFVFAVKRSDPVGDSGTVALTMSGHWKGRYYYEDGRKSVPFLADIYETRGSLEGRISEPNTIGSKEALSLFADLSGQINDKRVVFRKTYDGTGGTSHSVDYKGMLSSDRLSVAGKWTVGGASGRFELYRR